MQPWATPLCVSDGGILSCAGLISRTQEAAVMDIRTAKNFFAQFARSRTAAMLYAPHHEEVEKSHEVLVACPLLREV